MPVARSALKRQIIYGKKMAMNEELDAIKYYTASEKCENMINTIRNTLEFMAEFKIEPDEAVKQALMPVINEMKEWIK